MQVEEGALTELAGPYWTGAIGIDRGFVYADSYIMEKREYREKTRW